MPGDLEQVPVRCLRASGTQAGEQICWHLPRMAFRVTKHEAGTVTAGYHDPSHDHDQASGP